jgi:hypothetical protein
VQIELRKLPHPGLFEDYRVCPGCGGEFTVDERSKRLRPALLVVGLSAMVLTLLLYFQGPGWLAPALISYALWLAILGWANKFLRLVPRRRPDAHGP